MIIEILGAKMLAPYVGTSHFVWTAQIGVTLVALATGYGLGGRMADRSKGLRLLYSALVLAAGYLSLSIWWCEPVAFWCLQFPLPVGSLLAALILYFPPLALMALTSPFLVRSLTPSLSTVGASVGRLSAISTLGSVVGTVLVGYVLIPLLPNSRIMFLVSVTLTALGIAYFVIWEAGRRGGVLVWTAISLGVGAWVSGQENLRNPPEVKELFRGNSNFGLLQVLETSEPVRMRTYLNDRLTQNTYLVDERQSRSLFTYMLRGLARGYTPEIHDVLCVGMGVGIVPMAFARSGARVEVVEINEAILPVAQRYFDFEPARVRLTVADGRHYLAVSTQRYDTIVLDAFLGESVPSHLLSREALTVMKRRLKPAGTLVMNTITDSTPGRDYFLVSVNRTLRAVFSEVRVHAVGNGNVFFVAGDREGLSRLHAPDLAGIPEVLQGQVQGTYDQVLTLDPERGDVLTDDFNPTDYHDAPNREGFRRRLALAARSASR